MSENSASDVKATSKTNRKVIKVTSIERKGPPPSHRTVSPRTSNPKRSEISPVGRYSVNQSLPTVNTINTLNGRDDAPKKAKTSKSTTFHFSPSHHGDEDVIMMKAERNEFPITKTDEGRLALTLVENEGGISVPLDPEKSSLALTSPLAKKKANPTRNVRKYNMKAIEKDEEVDQQGAKKAREEADKARATATESACLARKLEKKSSNPKANTAAIDSSVSSETKKDE